MDGGKEVTTLYTSHFLRSHLVSTKKKRISIASQAVLGSIGPSSGRLDGAQVTIIASLQNLARTRTRTLNPCRHREGAGRGDPDVLGSWIASLRSQ
jgi:hypothetical protein